MEDYSRTPNRSITPFDSSYNTDTDKEYIGFLDKHHQSSHKRVISSDLKYFKVDSSPNIGNFCSSCIRLERQIFDLKKKLSREKDKFETREKHIRQLDSLLQIKDKRLKEEEAALRNEENNLGFEYEELKKIISELSQEKIHLENNNKALSKENAAINLGLKKSEIKVNELLKKMKKYEDGQSSIEEDIRSTILRNLEIRESNLNKKETEISLEYQKLNYENDLLEEKNFKLAYFEQNLLMQEQSIKLKFEELSSFSNELERSRMKLQQDQSKFEQEASNQLAQLKSKDSQILNQEKALKAKLAQVDIELEHLDTLKNKLQEQKMILDKEIHSYKNLQLEIVREPQEHSEFESDAGYEEKERYIEEMIERLNEEEKKFSERWAGFKKTEDNLRKEIEFYKVKCEELEQQLIGKDNCQFLDEDFQDRVANLQNKEEELINYEKNLEKEREEIDKTAELVKSLNMELIEQKKIQEEDEARIKIEKEKIVELLRVQEERIKMIAVKESELLKFKEELIGKEKELQVKEKNQSTPELTED